MKTRSLIAFCTLVSFALVQQTAISQKHYLAVNGGVTIGGPLGGDTGAEGTPVPGYTAILAHQYFFNEKLYLQSSPSLSLRAANYRFSSSGDTLVHVNIGGVAGKIPATYDALITGKIRLTVLELPLSIGFKTKRGFYVSGGTFASIIIGGGDRGVNHLEIGNEFGVSDTHYDNRKYINTVDAGVQMGGGWISSFGLTAFAECSRGFVPFYKPSFFESVKKENTSLYNTYFRMGLGYRFGL